MTGRILLLIVFYLAAFQPSIAQKDSAKAVPDTTAIRSDDPAIVKYDSMITQLYLQHNPFLFDDTPANEQKLTDSIPVYTDDVYKERLAVLDAQTPFHLDYNSKVEAFIHLYAVRKRELTSRMLGLQHVYFPMFEQILDQYELPLEFKYLAIVESALKPNARSRSGAVGLWQFIYSTGKIFNLEINSYIDERSDSYKSTIAACEYFTVLYDIYQDWELVMAAYNCGPGNVNKAIRRSGGKRNYWELWPYLPRETRGYIPAFIAVNYVMNYASEHNIYPTNPGITFFEYDTVQVKQSVTFDQISAVLDISIEEIEFLNPCYKRNVIPATGKSLSLYLPVEKIGLFIENEELVYNFNKDPEGEDTADFVVKEERKTHIVKSGEYLGSIASRYNCSVNDIRSWNSLRGSRIYPGQRIMIHQFNKVAVNEEKTDVVEKNSAVENEHSNEEFEYYTIQKGDTLWDIARAKGISIQHLKELNENLNVKKLKPGAKIIVGTSG